MSRFSVIVVAAGRGTRMGTAESKQHLPLAGEPILVHTLRLFERLDGAGEVVLVAGAADIPRCEGYVREYGLRKVSRVVAGGAERQASVYAGLLALAAGTEWVLIHDGVRPFVTEREVLRCWERARQTGAAVLGVPVKDTIKQVDAHGDIIGTPERKSLWAVHTPQAFRVSAILDAHKQAQRDGYFGTDDAMLMERAGYPVQIVEGSYRNVKITTPDDLEWAEWILGKGAADR